MKRSTVVFNTSSNKPQKTSAKEQASVASKTSRKHNTQSTILNLNTTNTSNRPKYLATAQHNKQKDPLENSSPAQSYTLDQNLALVANPFNPGNKALQPKKSYIKLPKPNSLGNPGQVASGPGVSAYASQPSGSGSVSTKG